MSLSSPWRRSFADLLAQHQQDAVGRHRAGDHFRQLFAGEVVVQIGGRIGGAQLMLQAPAEGDQQLGDLLMHRRFVRQQAFDLAQQGSLGNQQRAPQVARFDKAAVAGVIAKAEKNGDGDTQQAERRDG